MKKFKFPLTHSQIYLLKAIIGEDSKAIENYNNWIDSVNIENYIDGESYALIPALYKRLISLGFLDKNMNRYMGIYKKSLYKNSILLYTLRTLGDELNKKQIPFTLLKGIPLIIHYHEDIGIRSMGDIDMVVEKEDIPKTILILNELGYISDCGYDIFKNIETRHSYSFRSNHNLEIDLYWTPLPISYRDVKIDATKKFMYKDVKCNMLSAEDFILQVCLHGANASSLTSLKWIFDMHTILSNEIQINWKSLLGKLNKTRLSYVFYVLFDCYNELTSIKIPDWVIEELKHNGNTKLNIKHARKKIIKPKTLLGQLDLYGYNYRFRDKNIVYRAVHYPRHKLMMSKYNRYRDLFSAFLKKYVFNAKS